MAKRVYFAFHYQDVIEFRANVVRKHNFAEGVESAGYYDHSIWEETKNTSPSALKQLINKELDGTSVTVVLIGSDTWARRWVRYEIVRSIQRGNRVFGIHINSIKGKDEKTKPLGPNPFPCSSAAPKPYQIIPNIHSNELSGGVWFQWGYGANTGYAL